MIVMYSTMDGISHNTILGIFDTHETCKLISSSNRVVVFEVSANTLEDTLSVLERDYSHLNLAESKKTVITTKNVATRVDVDFTERKI